MPRGFYRAQEDEAKIIISSLFYLLRGLRRLTCEAPPPLLGFKTMVKGILKRGKKGNDTHKRTRM